MKSIKQLILLAGLTGGLFASMTVRAADTAVTNAPAETAAAAVTNAPSQTPAPPVAADQTPQPPPATPEPAAQPVIHQELPAIPAQDTNNVVGATSTDKGLRLNFRGVPLDLVLNYLSDAAGFIIVLETDVKGKVDVWSNQPMTKEEAVTLLNSVLNKNGYAAIQNGRTLTIVSRDEARKRDVPVKSGNNPDKIPKDAAIVTQIIPVRSLNAVQLAKDLAPLTEATLTANESGNSLLMTDTQTNIRRITEIIAALDSVSSTANAISVFALKYADAKALVTVIKETFPAPASSQSNNGGGFYGRFRGGGGGNPYGGGGPEGGDGSSGNGRTPGNHVSAVADELSNSLIVSAPEALTETIEQLVNKVDQPTQESSEVRVFTLKNADPSEMVELLNGLFPDETNSTESNRQQGRYGFFGGFPQQQSGGDKQSDRLKRMGRVLAVADRRTASVIVSASTNLMPQIDSMIKNLDINPAKKQKVFVYSLQNADVQDVQQVLQDLFPTGNSKSSASTTQNNPLVTRSQTVQQQQLNNTGTGLGTGLGGGNTAGRGF
jgi:type II secretory pathway component GspD/PulD (secretin)